MNIHDVPNFVIPTTFAPATTHVAGRPVEWPLGLQHALIDRASLSALDRLVTGEVRSWEDLESAELAIRALVLHDRVDCVLPAVLVTHRSGMDGGLTTVNYAAPSEPVAVMDVVRDLGLHNRPVFAEWLSVRNGALLDAQSFWTGKEDILLSTNESARQLAFAEYSLSGRMAAPYLATGAMIGAPTYFGDVQMRSLETAGVGNGALSGARRFFDHIDNAFAEEALKYSYVGLDLRLPLFIEILFGKARTRTELPATMLELRSDFAKARHKLWSLFESVQDERDSGRLTVSAERIRRAAESVIPAAYPPKLNVLRIILNSVVNAATLIGALGPGLDALMARDVTQSHVNKVDAARLLARELRRNGPDLLAPLKRHLSEAEVKNLGLS